ncbi:MAG: biotin--[acetyl-CoA-carboxylase] ligase [Chlamydiae bacterium]|jgi:BirA family biotin operon repressor/biotin-[acetyl-CoA-carboxylase] ligase|nr:biotin--[acetyl-CoA-carboxylase] ligase [Chlamydiota bacterium]
MFKEIHFPTIDSTHLYAISHESTYRGSFVFITAGHQTTGIGRKSDPWRSNGENLLASFVFPLPEKNHPNLAQLLCYSAIKVLEKWALEPCFKWPNDILVSHKKIGGVMGEIKETSAIVSIGLNVNMEKKDLDTIDIPATSLLEELRHSVSLKTLKHDLATQFFTDLTLFQKDGFTPFFSAFAAKLAFKGKLAKAGPHQGKIEGLHTDGRLILTANQKQTFLSDNSIEIIE